MNYYTRDCNRLMEHILPESIYFFPFLSPVFIARNTFVQSQQNDRISSNVHLFMQHFSVKLIDRFDDRAETK